MQLRIIAIVLLMSSISAGAQSLRYKDGRIFCNDLGARLSLSDAVTSEVFNDLRESMSKTKDNDGLVSGVNGLAKAASRLCAEAGLFESRVNLENLYSRILDRKPTKDEVAKAIKGADGKLSFQGNCFYLAMSPEFLALKRGERK